MASKKIIYILWYDVKEIRLAQTWHFGTKFGFIAFVHFRLKFAALILNPEKNADP